MKEKVISILKESGVPDFSFCTFDFVRDRLIPCRAKERLPQNAKTVMMCAFPYLTGGEKGNLSRYAAVRDYHAVLALYLERAAERLKAAFPAYHFAVFCDNSPIPEVSCAVSSGLGVLGDHGLLIHKRWGSYVFLGEIVTDAQMVCESRYAECLHCGACHAACPANAIGDKTRCLSRITQKKGELTSQEALLIQNSGVIWGCDICSEVCPMNHSAQTTHIREFLEDIRPDYVRGENPEGRAYAYRGIKVIKRNLNILKENR